MNAEQLQAFCAKADDDRHFLRQPFSQDGFTYATNGHILLRVPAVDGVGPIKHTKGLNAEKVLVGLDTAIYRKPGLRLPRKAALEECLACDGEGGGMHSCPNCDCKCDECYGTGKIDPEKTKSGQIDGRHYRLAYIRQLAALPGVEIGPADGEKPLLFRFDGGVGALMPQRTASLEEVEVEATTTDSDAERGSGA